MPGDNHWAHGAVLVTGASSGIGQAAALQLDRAGCQVFASVRRREDADRLCEQASSRLTPVLLDVTDAASITRAKEQISEACGDAGLWGLVNNAGISFRAPVELVPLDELRRLFEINVFGHIAVTQAFLPLIRQASGRILNVSSLTSQIVTPYHGPYSSTKACLNALNHALRLELKQFGIDVVLLIYGGVRTAIWEKAGRMSEEITQRTLPDAPPSYRDSLQKAWTYFYKKGTSGLTPDAAAQPIVHALSTPGPRNTYFVGPDARFYNVVDKLLYGKLRDWVIYRTMGL